MRQADPSNPSLASSSEDGSHLGLEFTLAVDAEEDHDAGSILQNHLNDALHVAAHPTGEVALHGGTGLLGGQVTDPPSRQRFRWCQVSRIGLTTGDGLGIGHDGPGVSSSGARDLPEPGTHVAFWKWIRDSIGFRTQHDATHLCGGIQIWKWRLEGPQGGHICFDGDHRINSGESSKMDWRLLLPIERNYRVTSARHRARRSSSWICEQWD